MGGALAKLALRQLGISITAYTSQVGNIALEKDYHQYDLNKMCIRDRSIVAQGEMMSTNMVVNYLKEQGVKAVLLNALDFMRTDKNAEPDPQ